MKKQTSIGGIVGAIFVIFGFVNYFANTYWDTPSTILVFSGLFLITFYCAANIKDIITVVRRRSTRHLTNAIAASLMVLGILAMINYISEKRNSRLDLTLAKQYTLAPQTVKILENLDKEVHVTAFMQTVYREFFDAAINEYILKSDNIIYEFVDPDKKPGIARNYGIRTYGDIVFETEGRTEKVNGLDEQTLTNALIKVTREGQKVIYFTTGHGEHDIDDSGRFGYSSARDKIKEQNYEIKTIDLVHEGNIPEDCSVLVINGPRSAIFPAEFEAIENYINKGGKVFFLLDPLPSPGFNEFFDKWGVAVGNDIVLDNSGSGRMMNYGPEVPIVTRYGPHMITRDFERQNTYYPGVRSVSPKTKGMPPLVSVDWLIRTTASSWAETEMSKVSQDDPEKRLFSEFNEGKDRRGPISMAAVVTKRLFEGTSDKPEASNKNGAMVIFGDSDFACNAYSEHNPNLNLFLNSLNWLAEEEDLVAIPPKDPKDRRVMMTAYHAKFVFYLTVLIIPGLILSSGITVFYRRKSL